MGKSVEFAYLPPTDSGRAPARCGAQPLARPDRLGMDEAELRVMARLALDESQGPAELSRHLHMTSGTMTTVLDRLVARGHLLREAHPTDRRRVSLRLTPTAHEAAHDQVLPMVEKITELWRGLSSAERQAVGRYLDELVALVADTGASIAQRQGPAMTRCPLRRARRPWTTADSTEGWRHV